MDKIYPRLKIIKKTCHCGAVDCKKLDGLPWQVFHIQYEGQSNPLKVFESASHDAACLHAGSRVDSSLSRKPSVNKKHSLTAGGGLWPAEWPS